MPVVTHLKSQNKEWVADASKTLGSWSHSRRARANGTSTLCRSALNS